MRVIYNPATEMAFVGGIDMYFLIVMSYTCSQYQGASTTIVVLVGIHSGAVLRNYAICRRCARGTATYRDLQRYLCSHHAALIKAIRSCKTLADEQALINKESASIRTSFKEEDSFTRHNNIAKLLYIYMLGWPAHFGQIECLKLVASPRFSDKRLGYLGIMLLLDENQDVLTLVTNSLKNDMNHSNMYAVGLALCTFANIASEEMSRDLSHEIEKLIGSSNTYIRKKAALCALRIIKKVPDLIDNFVSKSKNLLTDRNHGVLLAGITLVIEICGSSEAHLEEYRDIVPLLIRNLKALITTGYSPEHDVSGVADPFLQAKVLRLLRLLGRGDAQASEAMNDILAQVATNTDSTKNVGNSILYETVLTILDIEADSGLRVMAINILGKFLSNRDNNIRYVALHTLNKVVSMDTNAVQRHRNTILDCLRDGDISIRRRALELSYTLINQENVRVLTRELLAFLEVADTEFKLPMTTQICLAAERYAPNKRWHIDTVLRVLKLAGNYVREEILSAFIRLVAHTPELQAYTGSKLYTALQSDVSQDSLTLAAVWMIGEYSDILIEGGIVGEEQIIQVKDSDLVDLLESVLNSPYINTLSRQFVLTAVTKIMGRQTTSAGQRDRILTLLESHGTSPELEIQQRSVEFVQLISRGDIAYGVLERMPPPELKTTVIGTVSENRKVGSTRTDKDAVTDLLGDETLSSSHSAPEPTAQSAQSTQDLLSEIFGGGSSTSTAPPPATRAKSTIDEITSLFAASPVANQAPAAPAAAPTNNQFSSLAGLPSQPSQPPPPPRPSYTAYEKNGLKITLTPQTSAAKPGVVNILVRFQITGDTPASGVNFQAAVPKGATETQQMRIVAPQGVRSMLYANTRETLTVPFQSQVRLRLRISFALGGQTFQDQVDFSGFPSGLTNG
ncbi:Adaptor protein complex AP-1 gamma subunit [Sistotremastrum suecicum HHB10207 ss-3]|uniref:AP-1 complex subunit gamma n=1 Tax=Sistotremastrum suecicum HHB10207 ss-3 TaxID=1314776 RepID=A0A166HV88_9AGAM|nr:Adaptor protein complex AP-1 gamma subunit [Sistotremastrum suecicum HHB10207 ss-3]